MKRVFLSFAVLCTMVLSASAQINFPDGTSQETGTLSNVIVVQAEGTDTANGTALKTAMDAISGANTTPTVIQLAAGTYDLGTNTLTLRPYTLVRGVGRFATLITGTGSVIVEGGTDTVMRDLQIAMSAGGIGFRIQSGKYTDFFRVAFVLDVTGGVTSTGIQVLSGGEIDLVSCYFVGDSDNAGGSVTGLSVSGTNSAAYMYNTIMDLIALSSGATTGISTGSGATVEIITGEYLVEREIAGSDVSAITIGSGSRVIIKNSSILARVNGSSTGIGTVTIPTTGGLLVFGTIFEGDIPASSAFVSDTDHVIYSHSSQNFGATP